MTSLSQKAADAATPQPLPPTLPPYHIESAGDETWIWSDSPRRLIARCYRRDEAEFIVRECNG